MSLPKYIVNLYEIMDALKDKMNLTGGDVDTADLEKYIQDKLKEIIDLLNKLIGVNRVPKSLSLNKNIPAIINDFVLNKTFDHDIYLCGLTFSQSAWKAEDSFSLEVAGVLLFDRISTKEVAQYKHLNAFYPVPAGTDVKIIYHNESGNSKMAWFDIDYLEGAISQGGGGIDHDFDYKVEVEWEALSNADIDLHCILDCDSSKHIYYRKKTYGTEPNKVWLDYDYTSHMNVDVKPEVLTILGNPAREAHIYIKNYNAGKLTQPVKVKIYRGNSLYKTLEVAPQDLTLARKTFYICTLDISTGDVIERLAEIPNISGTDIDLNTCGI